MIYDSILDTIGNTPVVKLHRIAAEARRHLREGRSVQSGRLGQGSSRASRSSSMRSSSGLLKPGDTVVEATSGQHRHRARDGLRRARLSVRRADGRVVLDRAAQADARVRREGDPDAGRRTRQRHGARAEELAEEARLVPRAAVPEPGEPRVSTARPRPPKSCATSRAAARLFRHGLGHRRHADRRRRNAQARAPRGEDRRDASRPARRCSAARNGSRTRSRAGRRTSCPTC